ncbi:MAG: hypothetical protein V7L04_00400 [Nostoc sp.]|uniref:hypothetical protein n=1 Tax=Nostoc sp. TaxID=1180 RepID=UPI002FFB589E
MPAPTARTAAQTFATTRAIACGKPNGKASRSCHGENHATCSLGKPPVPAVAPFSASLSLWEKEDRAGSPLRIYNDPLFCSLPSCEFLIS